MEEVNYDLLFSYWLLVWYVLYVFGYIDYNPSLLLLIMQAVIIMFLYIKYFYYNKTTSKYLFIRIFVMKFLPLYLLWFANDVRIMMKDVYFTLGLFLLYIFYLYIHNTNMIEVYSKMSKYLTNAS